MADAGDQDRYFLAVWPDPSVRDRLDEWSQAIRTDRSARRVAPDNLHITLVFLGGLSPPQVAAVRKVAGETAWTGGSLLLDRVGYWRRARIVWAGSRDGCEPLSSLAEALRGGLRRIGFRIEARPFVPHVTLYRQARRRPKWAPQPISWRINEFCLVRSRLASEGARYQVLDHWSATGDVK